jgi:catechol 2,3-dioxygenase-like lactoylglutathione lyase family enzyme
MSIRPRSAAGRGGGDRPRGAGGPLLGLGQGVGGHSEQALAQEDGQAVGGAGDAEQQVERLVLVAGEPAGMRYAYVQDPEGNLIELIESSAA